MKLWMYYIPFLVQAFVISFDEFYFHWKRGLPKWERLGHPLDTLTVVACIGYVLLVPFSTLALIPYILLGAFSCLFVTKDEFVHKEHCPASEQWLHALLFLNHPLVLISMGFLWAMGEATRPFLTLQLVLIASFCLYQLVYWNMVWKQK